MTRSFFGPTATANMVFITRSFQPTSARELLSGACPFRRTGSYPASSAGQAFPGHALADDPIRLVQHLQRQLDPEAGCSPQVDDEERIDGLDRQVARLRSLADLVDVAGGATAGLVGARPIGRQRTPVRHEILKAERGHALLEAGLEHQIEVADDERVRADHDPAGG